jgi:hypothetical protein
MSILYLDLATKLINIKKEKNNKTYIFEFKYSIMHKCISFLDCSSCLQTKCTNRKQKKLKQLKKKEHYYDPSLGLQLKSKQGKKRNKLGTS